MGINVGRTHKAVNVGVGIGITDTQLDLIVHAFFQTHGNPGGIGVKAFGFCRIVKLGTVEHSLNPHGNPFKNVVAGRNAFCSGFTGSGNRTAAQTRGNGTEHLVNRLAFALRNHRRNFRRKSRRRIQSGPDVGSVSRLDQTTDTFCHRVKTCAAGFAAGNGADGIGLVDVCTGRSDKVAGCFFADRIRAVFVGLNIIQGVLGNVEFLVQRALFRNQIIFAARISVGKDKRQGCPFVYNIVADGRRARLNRQNGVFGKSGGTVAGNTAVKRNVTGKVQFAGIIDVV